MRNISIHNNYNLNLLCRVVSIIVLLAVVFVHITPLNSFAASSFEKKTICANEKNEVNYTKTDSYLKISINSVMADSYENKINNVGNNENGKKSNRESDACSNGHCPVSFCYPIIITPPYNYHVNLDKVNSIPMLKNWVIVSPIYSVFKPPKKSLV